MTFPPLSSAPTSPARSGWSPSRRSSHGAPRTRNVGRTSGGPSSTSGSSSRSIRVPGKDTPRPSHTVLDWSPTQHPPSVRGSTAGGDTVRDLCLSRPGPALRSRGPSVAWVVLSLQTPRGRVGVTTTPTPTVGTLVLRCPKSRRPSRPGGPTTPRGAGPRHSSDTSGTGAKVGPVFQPTVSSLLLSGLPYPARPVPEQCRLDDPWGRRGRSRVGRVPFSLSYLTLKVWERGNGRFRVLYPQGRRRCGRMGERAGRLC